MTTTIAQTPTADSSRPQPPPVIPENIPAELRSLPCWVCWRYELTKGTWRKPPVSCRTGLKADKTDPDALAPFEEAHAYYRAQGLDGVGFVFTPEGPFSGVDLDDCRDP